MCPDSNGYALMMCVIESTIFMRFQSSLTSDLIGHKSACSQAILHAVWSRDWTVLYRYRYKTGIYRYFSIPNTGIPENPIPKDTEIPVSPKTRYRKIPKYRYQKNQIPRFSVFLGTTFFLKIQRNFHLIFSKKRVNLTPMEKLLV